MPLLQDGILGATLCWLWQRLRKAMVFALQVGTTLTWHGFLMKFQRDELRGLSPRQLVGVHKRGATGEQYCEE